MTSAGYVVVGADIVAAEFGAAAVALVPAASAVTRTYTELLVAGIAARAPYDTGEYANSWHAKYDTVDGQLVGIASTAKPQALRLEYGFHGIDALGRAYNNPPQPHVLPATEQIAPQYELALLAMVEKLL